MKFRFTIFYILLAAMLNAQKDSVQFFLTQLKKRNLPDSSVGYYNSRIGNYYTEQNPAQALPYFRKAFQSAFRTRSNNLLYTSANNLSDCFLITGSYDSSLYYAKVCYDAAEKMKDNWLLYNSLNVTGSIYMEKLQLPEAKRNYDEAFQLAVAYPDIPHKSHIYQNMGNYYFKSLNFKKAIAVLKEGELIADKSNDQHDLMTLFSCLGQMYAYTGKADSVQFYLLTALDYFHKAGNIKEEAIVNQKLGSAYGLFNNTAKMEQYLDLAYQQFESVGNIVTAVNTLILKAGNYFKLYQFDNCLQTLNEAEPAALKIDQKPAIALSNMYRAGIYTLTEDTANAKKYQSIAEQLNHQINIPTFDKLNMMIKAIVFSARMKINQGDTTTQKTLLAAKNMIPASLMESTMETFSQNKKLVAGNKTDLIHTYQSMLPQDSAKNIHQYDSLVSQPIDSGYSALFNKQLMEMETRYKTRQKDDSLNTQTQLIGLKNKSITTRNYFLAGLIVLALLIFLLFLRSRNQSQKISRQYSEIHQLQSELTHRTGNFFNSINGMLVVALANSDDKATISSLQNRVHTINRLFKTLYSSPGSHQLPFAGLLASLCSDFEHSFGTANQIRIYQQCNADISKEEAVPLAFIITELMTNAMKYAFEETKPGEIHVEVSKNENKRILQVWDNGKGKDESVAPRQGSQGMSIIKNYSKNLGGNISTCNENGFHFKMEF